MREGQYIRMGFGKHRGKLLCEVPGDYLSWVLGNCTELAPGTMEQIREELEYRVNGGKPSDKDVSELVRKVRREAAMQFHPDRTGGSHAPMAALNWAFDRLLELAKD